MYSVVIMFIFFVSFEKFEGDIAFDRGVYLAMKFLGEITGIIAGIIGIFLSRTKNDKIMKCIWKGFITMVSLNQVNKKQSSF